MPNGLVPSEAAVANEKDYTLDEFFLDKREKIEASQHLYFMHNRLALRLVTEDTKVYVFGLSPEHERQLLDILTERADV